MTANNELLFSKFAVKIAQHRAMSSSWMAGADQEESQKETEAEGNSKNAFDFKSNLEL